MKRAAVRAMAGVGAAVFALGVYGYVTLPDVRPLASTNPSNTAFMELRAREAEEEGRKARREQRWMPYSRISQNLKRAVLVAEDDAFWDHEGIDVGQIRRTIEIDLRRGRAMRGASTITQQLAKNLYLSPSRDPFRKVRELIIARRLEAELSKARIFEIYLNVIEWGDGIWGAEAAARRYFGVSASSLTREQAALLAGAIINPRLYSPARPPARLLRRQRIILRRMGSVEPPPPAPAVAAPGVVETPATAHPDAEGLPDAEHWPEAEPAPEEAQPPPAVPDELVAPPSDGPLPDGELQSPPPA